MHKRFLEGVKILAMPYRDWRVSDPLKDITISPGNLDFGQNAVLPLVFH